ncbi:hypothetical protein HN51_063488 [Arachis hypogaea]
MEETKAVTLKPIEATPSTFKDYGQVIEASPDGDEFYIMHIENRPLKFSNITHHASVTQCLGSIGGHAWYLGVAKPSIVESDELKDNTGKKIVQSRCGHSYAPPAIDDVIDHTTHSFKKDNGVVFLIDD